jgi:hypothetical protein
MRFGFTGTQEGMTPPQEYALEKYLQAYAGVAELHHGDCIGADAQAHALARFLDIAVHLHPPTIPDKRAFCRGAKTTSRTKTYLVRNRDIVDLCDVLLAAVKGPEEVHSGTWSTVRYALKTSRPVIIFWPSGEYGAYTYRDAINIGKRQEVARAEAVRPRLLDVGEPGKTPEDRRLPKGGR